MQTLVWTAETYVQLLDRARALLEREERAILGIAGAPACGKSTLCAELGVDLQRSHPSEVALVGMDAFHIGHRVLQQHDLVDVKGAPKTFDVDGYLALLSRLRHSRTTVYAPEFHREIEDSLAHVVEIPAQVRLVITEGNYLLLPTPPWDQVRTLLDEAWFVHLESSERQRRMVARHQRYGRTLAEARARTFGSDETNAVLVDQEQNRADLRIECLT